MKKLLRKCVESDAIWRWVVKSLIWPSERVMAARKAALVRRIASKIGPEPMVLGGPFTGLRYPGSISVGSALFPKLLGTYEAELFEVLRELIEKSLVLIVNIGATEGYYAVGFARIFPDAQVVAFDISESARSACLQMARCNGSGNILIKESCTRDDLLAIEVKNQTLILSDCEGYEKYLFDIEVARHLRKAYLIIELHDYTDRTLTGRMHDTFSCTHRVTLVDSTPDSEKLKHYNSPLISAEDQIERGIAFSEHRCEKMQWLVAFPND